MKDQYVQIKKLDGSKFESGYPTVIARKASSHKDSNKYFYLYTSGWQNIVIEAELCEVWQIEM